MDLLTPLQMDQFRQVITILTGMYATSRILDNRKFIQHGSTTLFQHCRNVALMSLKLARMFHIKVDEKSMVRGALLHDYYLYDWHDKTKYPSLHGYKHPTLALVNAEKIYTLNPIEVDVIKHHMFPLTICPPKTKEGVLVSIADKLCSTYETFKLNEVHLSHRRALVSHNRKAAFLSNLIK
jgi:uncharacterized protein